MKIAFFDPEKFDAEFKGIIKERFIEAAEVIKKEAASDPVLNRGTTSYPIYKTGDYAGQPWTSRDAGRLRKSIRVVVPYADDGTFKTKTNVRVYAGHYMAWYAAIVEFKSKYMRRAKNKSLVKIKSILGING